MKELKEILNFFGFSDILFSVNLAKRTSLCEAQYRREAIHLAEGDKTKKRFPKNRLFLVLLFIMDLLKLNGLYHLTNIAVFLSAFH